MSNLGQAPRLASRRNPVYARLKTEPGSTLFWEGGEFGVNYEYLVESGSPFWWKFSSSVDFLLTRQTLSCDAGAIRLRIFSAAQGTETSPFSGDPIVTRSMNNMSFTQSKTSQVVIGTGGTFTPDAGQLAGETIRLRTAAFGIQRSTITGSIGDQRGRPAGDYYISWEVYTGGTDAEGVFDLTWGEFSPNAE